MMLLSQMYQSSLSLSLSLSLSVHICQSVSLSSLFFAAPMSSCADLLHISSGLIPNHLCFSYSSPTVWKLFWSFGLTSDKSSLWFPCLFIIDLSLFPPSNSCTYKNHCHMFLMLWLDQVSWKTDSWLNQFLHILVSWNLINFLSCLGMTFC
jgi:hypothetical protein